MPRLRRGACCCPVCGPAHPAPALGRVAVQLWRRPPRSRPFTGLAAFLLTAAALSGPGRQAHLHRAQPGRPRGPASPTQRGRQSLALHPRRRHPCARRADRGRRWPARFGRSAGVEIDPPRPLPRRLTRMKSPRAQARARFGIGPERFRLPLPGPDAALQRHRRADRRLSPAPG